MGQIGVVKAYKNHIATVFLRRESACGGNCNSCGGECETAGLAIQIETALSLKEGDVVEIEGDNRVVLKYSIILYGIPLLMFTLGTVLGIYNLKNEMLGFLVGIFGLVSSFFVLKILDKRLIKNKNAQFKIKRIME